MKNTVTANVERERVTRTTRLLGVRLHDVSVNALLDRIVSSIIARKRLLIVNANVNLINLAQRDARLVELFERADIAFCDGAGVQFALWLQNRYRPARHTPPQWIIPLGTRLAAQHASVFWLGGEAETVATAAKTFTATTGMRCSGVQHGFFDLCRTSVDTINVVRRINDARPDLLLVNLGMPQQELWLLENWHRLDVTVALTGGALVDHIAGRVKRPPMWVSNIGLEWLVRLAIEPNRLWRRYLIGLPLFGVRLLLSLLKKRPIVVKSNWTNS